MTLKALGKVRIVAFVDVNAKNQGNTKFGEDVAIKPWAERECFSECGCS
jgi:hypothetical protein